MPPISFVASATAIARVGAVPVFADVDPETINLDLRRAAEAITGRTRAIVLVHFAGCPADLDAFTRLCADRHLALIEDCAHAPGAVWSGRPVGGFGAFGSFSFQASKNLTAGEGGMLLTDDPELAETARSIAHQGRRTGGAWYEHVRLGTNARLTGFQAALLLSQLKRLPDHVQRRHAAAARLRDGLKAVEGSRPGTRRARSARRRACVPHLLHAARRRCLRRIARPGCRGTRRRRRAGHRVVSPSAVSQHAVRDTAAPRRGLRKRRSLLSRWDLAAAPGAARGRERGSTVLWKPLRKCEWRRIRSPASDLTAPNR